MSLLPQHATPDSLVVLDELGRGTSTFDGYAIAHAVLQHISSKVDCRLLFATHYHPLTTEFAANPRVSLGHMAALVGTSGNRCPCFWYACRCLRMDWPSEASKLTALHKCGMQ